MSVSVSLVSTLPSDSENHMQEKKLSSKWSPPPVVSLQRTDYCGTEYVAGVGET